MLKAIARRVLPSSVYGEGRKWRHRYREYRRRHLPRLSEAELTRILSEELGVHAGAVVFVHSSLDRLPLDFPFFRVLGLLRDAVGEEGTLLFPASHLEERPEDWLARGEVFDVRKTPTTMGLLPELARRQRGAVRSLHPTHSVVALGRRARELTADHHRSVYPCGEQSPYHRMVGAEGLIVGLGVDVDVLTFVHCIEDQLREQFPVETRGAEVYEARVLDAERQEHLVQTLVAHRRIYWRHMIRYMRQRVPDETCRRMQISGVPYYRADARKLHARMAELAAGGTTIYNRLIHRGGALEPLLTGLATRLG